MNPVIDISGVTLQTERLTLRPFRQEDLEDFFAYASVDGVGQMAGWKPHQDRSETQRILDRFISHNKTFALVREGQVIGSVGIEFYDEEKYPELADGRYRALGFVLARAHWGRGLMAEALAPVIGYLFRDVGLDGILCSHYLTNRQSARVQEKCGFRFYARAVRRGFDGGEKDSVMNLLRREDWLAAGNG